VDGKAKSELLKKITTQGFSIEENGSRMVLRPRGAEGTASLTIEEVEPDVWRVTGAEGKYASFARGHKRKFFENHLTLWVTESRLRSL
jgi:hypothetical protein